MEDPILEALTFTLDSDLNLAESVEKKSANKLGNSTSPSGTGVGTSSKTLLGLNQNIPCIMPHCQFVSSPTSFQDKSAKCPTRPGAAVKELDILEHLLCEHNFVIDQVDEIANVYKYVLYWRERFRGANLLDFCVSVLMDRPIMIEKVRKDYSKTKSEGEAQSNQTLQSTCSSSSKNVSKLSPLLTSASESKKDSQKFFMLTSLFPEDKKLRQRLWNERIEMVLDVLSVEREQKDFCRQCLFCRDVITGNRVNLFNHMADAHSFHIGQPDNVVFVNELLDLINDKLNACECIYCGKKYKDKTAFRGHMRKKGHKRIPESDGQYDKYYIINYLEPGKTWKSFQEEEPEDDRREEEWLENFEVTSIVCLFCNNQNASFDAISAHMLANHNFDFKALTSKYNFYQKVKIVNFIRRNVHQNICLFCEEKVSSRQILLTHVHQHNEHRMTDTQSFPSSEIWDRAEYFFPTYENDQFLICLDRDDDNEASEHNVEMENMTSGLVIAEDLPQMEENRIKMLRTELSSI